MSIVCVVGSMCSVPVLYPCRTALMMRISTPISDTYAFSNLYRLSVFR